MIKRRSNQARRDGTCYDPGSIWEVIAGKSEIQEKPWSNVKFEAYLPQNINNKKNVVIKYPLLPLALASLALLNPKYATHVKY